MLRLNSNRVIAAVVTAAVAIGIFFGCGLFAFNNSYADAESEGFVITDYSVDVTVTENRTYKITETIVCDFNQYKHGIYRSIPTVFKVKRADGSSSKMAAYIENFDANTIWDTDSDYDVPGNADSYFTVRLGDPDELVTGVQKYTISYDYVCSDDTLEGADEFYFNVIGSGWNTDINHVYFNINMPKSFDSNKVGFSLGDYGNAGVSEGELLVAVNDRVISGETVNPMGPYEALTIRAELPDEYFVKNNNGNAFLWAYLLIVLLAIVSIVMCFKFGRDEKIVPVISFEPPEGYNSLDVGQMDHLDPTDDDVLSLLIYLADKGYLTIEPIPDRHGNVEKSKKFYFHKIKEYDGDNLCERVFLDGLFGGSTTVSSDDLEDSFYITVQDVAAYARGFTADLVSRKGRLPITLIILASIGLMYLPIAGSGGFSFFIATITKLTTIGFLAGIASIIVMIICWGFIQHRTKLGVELAGQARGLKEFIETAEKDRIEALIEQDPQSFYKIIPYAMVLGVSDKWIKKFKGITLERPSWYLYDNPMMEGYMIGHILSSTLNHTMSEVATAPSSDGGGGFSGGGAGGGGGGSW